jgi:hypothetical protein
MTHRSLCARDTRGGQPDLTPDHLMPNTPMLMAGSVQKRRLNLMRPYDVRFMMGSPLELELADCGEGLDS